jgi:hypothetical protein
VVTRGPALNQANEGRAGGSIAWSWLLTRRVVAQVAFAARKDGRIGVTVRDDLR